MRAASSSRLTITALGSISGVSTAHMTIPRPLRCPENAKPVISHSFVRLLRALGLRLDTSGTQAMDEKSHLGHRPSEHASPDLLERPLRLCQISAELGAKNLHHEDRTDERVTEYEPRLAVLGQKTPAQVVRYAASS